MTFQDLLKLYEEKKKKYGLEAYRHISELLSEAKEIHKSDWLKNPTPKKDHEQSWKGFKGNNLEKLIVHIIKDEVESLLRKYCLSYYQLNTLFSVPVVF